MAAVVLLAGCGGAPKSLTVELAELDDSGITGEVRLEAAGGRTTRMTVTEVRGGRITAAWIATGTCGDSGDEIITVHPPAGTAPIVFADLTETSQPLVALFLARGRFVSCGAL